MSQAAARNPPHKKAEVEPDKVIGALPSAEVVVWHMVQFPGA